MKMTDKQKPLNGWLVNIILIIMIILGGWFCVMNIDSPMEIRIFCLLVGFIISMAAAFVLIGCIERTTYVEHFLSHEISKIQIDENEDNI